MIIRGLYQHRCYVCSAASEAFLCSCCEQEILWVRYSQQVLHQEQFCQRCGIEIFRVYNSRDINHNASEKYCQPCRDAVKDQPNFAITCNYPLAYYQGLFAQLLQWYKFDKEWPLAKYFAALILQTYQARFSGYWIVPVPPRWAKLRQEAWDQVRYMCPKSLPVLDLLQRKGKTQQKQLDRAQRLEQLNFHNIYYLALPARRLVWQQYRKKGPLHLLFLDDVYTTGATIDMCRRALLPLEQEGWIAQVRSLSLCVVP